MMPRMDGYKATQAIRHLPDKDKACIQLVAMTANAFEEDKRDAVAAGMNGHIASPGEGSLIVRSAALRGFGRSRRPENCPFFLGDCYTGLVIPVSRQVQY